MNYYSQPRKGYNSYFNKFQEAQMNLNAVIEEERLKKRIEKSKKKQGRSYD